MTEPFAGAVLTGGSSSRLGRDKALLDVEGVVLAERVARALRGAGAASVSAVGGAIDDLSALGCFDTLVPDLWPGEGPLGGILTALATIEEDLVVVLACDTPQVTSDAPRRLVESLGAADAAVAVVGGRDQPLTAVWRTSTARAVLHHAFESGERAPRAALRSLRVTRVELPAREVEDVDRPEDLSRYARPIRDRTSGPDDEWSDG